MALAVVVGAALTSGTATAERAQKGNLVVSLNGGISPRKLPRHERAPVAVRLAGHVVTSDRAPLPRVNWIKLELAWRGKLDVEGLPICPLARLRGTTTRQARETCPGAGVGEGRLFAKIFVPNQPPFDVNARLTAFNGLTKTKRSAVLIHAYATEPPVSFVIPFSVHHQEGSFKTVLVALIRRSAGPWPHVADFSVQVSRRFNYEGHEHSYLSASCPVPHGFTAAPLSLARATYTFDDGRQVGVETVRSCSPR